MPDLFEVEVKYRLEGFDRVHAVLSSLGSRCVNQQVQVDQYFAHPIRDFGSTDEALRIRTIGTENRLTYKGPILERDSLDRQTKTRREIELAFQDGLESAENLAEIWGILGFRRVHVVRKTRESFRLDRAPREFEICLDEVEGLGRFLEIETLATQQDKSQAQIEIGQLAVEFGVNTPERRSYLEMLLELESA